MRKPLLRVLVGALLLVSAGLAPAAAPAFTVSESSDAYAELQDPDLNEAFLAALAAAGESTSGRFSHLPVTADAFSGDGPAGSGADRRVVLHVVQDRGLPRGETYPTYVFTLAQEDGAALELIVRTLAGKRIYYAGPDTQAGCLLSADRGYSDICLVDASGTPASDLPGLRDDVWTDLIKLLGL